MQNNLNTASPGATTESSQQTTEEVNAVRLVGASVESNKLNVTLTDLRAKKNPNGAGVSVYVPQVSLARPHPYGFLITTSQSN